jgi:uncharacterized RDD family membrane protein YckC
MTYAGFWPRAYALLIDLLLWVPLIAAHIFLQRYSTATAILSLLVIGPAGFVYTIYFHARWGQTIGKMVARIRVTQLDGTPIGIRHAFLRSSLDLLLWIAYTPWSVYVLATWSGPEWSSLTWADQGRVLAERNPLYGIYDVVEQGWLWSELVVLLFNKKRRALHDFIAGTVVVKIPCMVGNLSPAEARGTML